MNLLTIINFIMAIFGIIVFFIIKKKSLTIGEKLGLIDEPSINKIHNKKTPLVAIFPFFILFVFLHLLYLSNSTESKDIFFIFIASIISFIIGLLDDKKNLSYLIKFLTFGFFILFVIYFSENLVLDKLYFETFNKIYSLGKINSLVFTLLCLLLLINAINLCDGINGLCSGIILIWIIYLQLRFNLYLNLIPLILVLSLTVAYIYRGNFFLGNSGSHFLSTFSGFLIIFVYIFIIINY